MSTAWATAGLRVRRCVSQCCSVRSGFTAEIELDSDLCCKHLQILIPDYLFVVYITMLSVAVAVSCRLSREATRSIPGQFMCVTYMVDEVALGQRLLQVL
jgi:hypothetical protein